MAENTKVLQQNKIKGKTCVKSKLKYSIFVDFDHSSEIFCYRYEYLTNNICVTTVLCIFNSISSNLQLGVVLKTDLMYIHSF